MEWPTDNHLATVWRKLDRMEPGQIIIIKEQAPNFPDLFIQCCKMWIDCYHKAEFNKDYSIIKKLR